MIIKKICDALIRVTYTETDWHWVQGQCLHFLSHQDEEVCRLAVICLGHIARMHHKIDPHVILILQDMLDNKKISGSVSDALDDIKMFARNL